MLENQFYLRLVFIAIFGIIFIYAMINLAKMKSAEQSKQKHTGLKVLSIAIMLLGIFLGVTGVTAISSITFPTEMLEQPLSENMIIRSTNTVLHWGYPTNYQNTSIVNITNLFSCLAFAAYFACFKKSNSKWWSKFLKTIYIILLYAFFVSATDWHYFDIYELWITIFFLLMSFVPIVVKKRKKSGACDGQ